MAPIWLLFVVVLVLGVVALARVARGTRDETRATVRSFDAFREALSPGVATLGSSTGRLRERLDRGPRAPQR